MLLDGRRPIFPSLWRTKGRIACLTKVAERHLARIVVQHHSRLTGPRLFDMIIVSRLIFSIFFHILHNKSENAGPGNSTDTGASRLAGDARSSNLRGTYRLVYTAGPGKSAGGHRDVPRPGVQLHALFYRDTTASGRAGRASPGGTGRTVRQQCRWSIITSHSGSITHDTRTIGW